MHRIKPEQGRHFLSSEVLNLHTMEAISALLSKDVHPLLANSFREKPSLMRVRGPSGIDWMRFSTLSMAIPLFLPAIAVLKPPMK
jgi:hypothetical protein